MNFELTDELAALQDSLRRLLSDLQARRAATDEGTAWRQLAELGVAGLLVPERHGGFGGSAEHVLPVMQELGRAPVAVPFLSCCVLGATALATADDATARTLLPALATGELQVAWAHDEPARQGEPASPSTTASNHHGWRLTGTKRQVLHAASAHQFVVSARVDGDAVRPHPALFLVDRDAPGVSVRGLRLVDGTPAGELRLQDAHAVPLRDGAVDASSDLEAVASTGIAAICAEMAGAMEAAFSLTVAYVNTRKQFGRLIGANQALRHRVAEMQVALEMARSMTVAAAVAAARGGLHEPASRLELHRAKFLVGRNARVVCQQAIQLHGGVGMTEEYAVGRYLRRVHVLDHLFGDATAHADWLAHAG